MHAMRRPTRDSSGDRECPVSIQEILDHADELAQRFEDYEPAEGDERPVEEYLLAAGRCRTRARSERQIVDAVTARADCRDLLEQDR